MMWQRASSRTVCHSSVESWNEDKKTKKIQRLYSSNDSYSTCYRSTRLKVGKGDEPHESRLCHRRGLGIQSLISSRDLQIPKRQQSKPFPTQHFKISGEQGTQTHRHRDTQEAKRQKKSESRKQERVGDQKCEARSEKREIEKRKTTE